jgi:hypothetical protein
VILDGALKRIVQAYRESGRRWVVGGVRWIDEKGRSLGRYKAPPTWITTRMFASHDWGPISQIGAYLSRGLFTELGGYSDAYSVVTDTEMFARALSIVPYARLAQPVACYRRTGKNYSFVNREKFVVEQHRIRAQFGPQSELEAQFWRYVIKLRINLANPDWLMFKLAERARSQMGSQRTRYF